MTPHDAQTLLTMATGHWPSPAWSDATIDVWLGRLVSLDFGIAVDTVEALMESTPKWTPQIGVFIEQYRMIAAPIAPPAHQPMPALPSSDRAASRSVARAFMAEIKTDLDAIGRGGRRRDEPVHDHGGHETCEACVDRVARIERGLGRPLLPSTSSCRGCCDEGVVFATEGLVDAMHPMPPDPPHDADEAALIEFNHERTRAWTIRAAKRNTVMPCAECRPIDHNRWANGHAQTGHDRARCGPCREYVKTGSWTWGPLGARPADHDFVDFDERPRYAP